eukprot:snap_masked-scaffold_13-processed-gene-2.22-mRNA-1 protein AED:1.00 eAED:1.00 QI:0/-1/0/0/-1/1/1/0/479
MKVDEASSSTELVQAPKNLLFVLFLVSCASSLEYGDEQLVPSSYNSLSVSLNATVSALGSLTFGRSFLQTFASLFVSPFLENHSSLFVLGLSCFTFGLTTILTGLSSEYFVVFILRALTGLSLAFAVPSLRNFMSNITSDSNRGSGFGFYYFFTFFGSIIWGFIATKYGNVQFHFGGETYLGWRLVFCAFGSISVLLGFFILSVSSSFDEFYLKENKPLRNKKSFLQTVRIILKKKTFLLIAAQGVVGSMPWKAFGYLAVLLQRAGTGFTDDQAATVVAVFQVGVTLGTLFGGYVADKLHHFSRDKGYILTAQISAFSLMPFSFLCLEVIPHDPDYLIQLSSAFFCFGLFISWGGAVNNSLFSATTPESLRSAVFALNYGVEGSLSSAAIPLVGYLSESTSNNQSQKLSNNIFYLCSAASVWLIIVYSFLYKPYRRESNEIEALNNSFSDDGTQRTSAKKKFKPKNIEELEYLNPIGKH